MTSTQKKEIKISKKHLTYLAMSFLTSFIIILGISHLGDIYPLYGNFVYDSPLTGDKIYEPRKVIELEKYTHSYGYQDFREVYEENIEYLEQFKHFYLPVVFKEHLLYFILVSIIIYMLLLFRDNYKLRLK